jgi:heavy metal sensor kinase
MSRRWLKSRKLSWKIATLYALLFSLVLIVLGAVVFWGVKNYMDREAAQRINEVSLDTADAIVTAQQEETGIYIKELIAEAEDDTTINIKVADPYGNVVNNSDNFVTPDVVQSASTGIFETADSVFVKNFPVSINGTILARIQVAKNMRTPYEFLNTLLRWMVISDAAGIFVSFLVGWLVSKNMFKPINKIMKTAEEIGSSDLSNRIEVPPSADELSQMATTFNDMLDRIEDSFIKQGRFTADASHELRTPLTVIQGYVGMLDRWGKFDSKILQESIDAIQSETNNMIYIMERLLFLARGDNRSQIVEKKEFDVAEMMSELEKETRLLAPDNNITFEFDNSMLMFADRKLIKQMLRAILDNSIKFTPKGGRIEMTCTRQADHIIFKLSDTGAGIPKADQDHIFERFYRVDKARDRRTGGSGLGLSIVQWILKEHEGQIKVDSAEGKGTTMTISLPVN